MNMITIRDISKSYNELPALKRINLQIDRGELFGVIGPDGAGKTSFFRILATLILPDTGSVEIDGLDGVHDYKKIRKLIGYMPGRFSLYHDLTVKENLLFYASVFAVSLKKNYELIRDIMQPLEPFMQRRAGQLSGGMKQKLALSCALIHRPGLLILDEPTTGVDAVSRSEFWNHLKRLKSYGMTLLVSTPYMDEAARCDRLMLLQEGEVLGVGTPEELLSDYNAAIFTVRAEPWYNLLRAFRQDNRFETVFAFGRSVHISSKDPEWSTSGQIVKAVRTMGFQEVHVEQVAPTIEDCFIRLMTSL